MRIIAMIIPFLLAGFSCNNGGSSQDSRSDQETGPEERDSENGEAGLDSDTVDSIVDTSELTGEESDAVDADVNEFDGSGEVEHIDLVPLTPSRPAMPCGPNCRQVTFLDTGDRQIEYDVWGDLLVIGTLDMASDSVTHQIALVDLTSLTYFIIDEKNGNEPERPIVNHPAIWEYTIVYNRGFRVTPGDNYDRTQMVVDLSTSTRYPFRNYVYPFGSSALGSIHLFSSIAVWMDDRTSALGGDNVYMMDLEASEEILVSDHCCLSHNPQIYGTRIVYDEGISGSGMNVWLYDVGTGEHRQLTDGDWDQFRPDIYEDTVVWTDGRNGGTAMSETNMDVFMMDLGTGEERAVCDHPATQKAPVFVWGSRVTYADCRSDPVYPDEGAYATEYDIFMTDIVTGEETQLTSLPGIEYYPLIYGNRVYFAKKDLEDLWSVFEITLE